MQLAIDEEGLVGLGGAVVRATVAVGLVDLDPLAAAVWEGMPASLSAHLVGVVSDLEGRLRSALQAIELEAGRWRLAAEQYAAADRVVAGVTAAPALATGAPVLVGGATDVLPPGCARGGRP